MARRRGKHERDLRYRDGKIVQKHTMIKGLHAFLDQLQQLPEIQTMTPGAITNSRGGKQVGGFRLENPEFIANGITVIAKQGNSCQRVIIVSSRPVKAFCAVYDLGRRLDLFI